MSCRQDGQARRNGYAVSVQASIDDGPGSSWSLEATSRLSHTYAEVTPA